MASRLSTRADGFVSIPGADRDDQASAPPSQRRSQMADMRKYASSTFIKVDDLEDGPEQKVIVEIAEGKDDKPVATFDDGTKLSLNGTNVNTLIRAYGPNEIDWLQKRIELYAGTLRYN